MSEIEEIFAEIQKDLEQSITKLGDGKMIDITQLDKKAKEFCSMIKLLDPKTARSYEPHLAEMIENLNLIVTRLDGLKSGVEDSIDSSASRKKAHNAYGATMIANKNTKKN